MIAAAFGCSLPATDSAERRALPYDLGKADTARAEGLAAFHPDLAGDAVRLDLSLTEGHVERAIEVFSSSWWPHRSNGIAWRWSAGEADDGAYDVSAIDGSRLDALSPVEKYDLLVEHRGALPTAASVGIAHVDPVSNAGGVHPALRVIGPATAWTLQRRGRYRPTWPESWEGYCNGWSAYATSELAGAPARDVRVRFEGGALVECAADAAGCVLFRMADIEALMIAVYFDDRARMLGDTCGSDPSAWPRDAWGRPTERRCRDVNPAQLHVVMTRFLAVGVRRPQTPHLPPVRMPFIVDHVAGSDIWNFPVVAFRAEYGTVSFDRDAALRAICGSTECDVLDPRADAFVEVHAIFEMVSDDVGAEALALPAADRETARIDVPVHYMLELEHDSGVSPRIVGGEWLGGSVSEHPDFIWYSEGPQSDRELADDTNDAWHTPADNPHIRVDIARALLACANDPSTCEAVALPDPADNICAGHCGEQITAAGGGACSCDPCCFAYDNCCDGATAGASRRYVEQVCEEACWLGEP